MASSLTKFSPVSQIIACDASGLPVRGGRVPCSGNLLHLAPAFQRCPDAALKPEAVDRRRRIDGADAVEADAGPLEAAFLQHPARGRVGDARAGLQRVVRQVGEGIV